MSKVVVINITSLSYSGSTWLNLMLGSHSEAFCIGEMKRLLNSNQTRCMVHGEECPLWSSFALDDGENPFLKLARLTGKRLLVVNNSRKFLPAQQHPQIESRFIHLIRDLRAVLASALRKRPNRSTWRTSKWLAHNLRRNERLVRRQDPRSVITTHYEALTQDTGAELERLCDFLGVAYEPQMQEYWVPDHHFVGGNRGTLFTMLRRSDNVSPPVTVLPPESQRPVNWDLDLYDKIDPLNFVDERWKKELTDRQLRVFGFWAGWRNRRVGYPRALDRGEINLAKLKH